MIKIINLAFKKYLKIRKKRKIGEQQINFISDLRHDNKYTIMTKYL